MKSMQFLLDFRAMAGNTSLSENYAFAGMSHIFDQHASAGGYKAVSLSSYHLTSVAYTFLAMVK